MRELRYETDQVGLELHLLETASGNWDISLVEMTPPEWGAGDNFVGELVDWITEFEGDEHDAVAAAEAQFDIEVEEQL